MIAEPISKEQKGRANARPFMLQPPVPASNDARLSNTELKSVLSGAACLHPSANEKVGLESDDVISDGVLDAGIDIAGRPSPTKQLGFDGLLAEWKRAR